jgi:hypothetical protein
VLLLPLLIPFFLNGLDGISIWLRLRLWLRFLNRVPTLATPATPATPVIDKRSLANGMRSSNVFHKAEKIWCFQCDRVRA